MVENDYESCLFYDSRRSPPRSLLCLAQTAATDDGRKTLLRPLRRHPPLQTVPHPISLLASSLFSFFPLFNCQNAWT